MGVSQAKEPTCREEILCPPRTLLCISVANIGLVQTLGSTHPHWAWDSSDNLGLPRLLEVAIESDFDSICMSFLDPKSYAPVLDGRYSASSLVRAFCPPLVSLATSVALWERLICRDDLATCQTGIPSYFA